MKVINVIPWSWNFYRVDVASKYNLTLKTIMNSRLANLSTGTRSRTIVSNFLHYRVSRIYIQSLTYAFLTFIFLVALRRQSHSTDRNQLSSSPRVAEASLRYIMRMWIDASGMAVDYDSQLLSIVLSMRTCRATSLIIVVWLNVVYRSYDRFAHVFRETRLWLICVSSEGWNSYVLRHASLLPRFKLALFKLSR